MEDPEILLLLRSSAAGDTGAFRRIVDGHRQYAFALAFRLLCDEEEARDVAQEAFIRVWRHLPRFDGRSKFTTWLYTIVTHLAYDRLRAEQRRTRPERIDDAGGREVPDIDASPDGELLNRELAAAIRRIAGRLPLKQRMVFTLRDIEEWSIEEIGASLGMSAGTVRANLSYARQAIRKAIERSEQ